MIGLTWTINSQDDECPVVDFYKVFFSRFWSFQMSKVSEISVAAANAGELNQPKPRWMPLEGNPEVKFLFFL